MFNFYLFITLNNFDFHEYSLNYVLIYLLGYIFFSILLNCNNHIFIALKEFNKHNLMIFLQYILLLFFLLFIYLFNTFNLDNVIFCYFLSQLMCLIFSIYLGITQFKKFRFVFDYNQYKEILLYCIKGHPGRILWGVNEKIDFIIIGFLLSTAAVGIYSISFAISESVIFLSSSISTILMAFIVSEKKSDKILFTCKVIRITFFYTLIGTVFLAFYYQ